MEKITKLVANDEVEAIEPEKSLCRDGYQRTPGKKTNADMIDDFAQFYGLSSRRLRAHITGATTGSVLGITYEYRKYTFHSRPEQLMGPIPDKPTVYILPRGAKSAAPTVHADSAVSSYINAGQNRFDKELPTVELSANNGYSGPVVCLNCHI